MATLPETLVYPRHRTRGRFAVHTPDGAPVAEVRVSRGLRTRFEATTPDGTLLCRGRRRALGSRWTVTDGTNTEILSLREHGRHREVLPKDGWPHTIETVRMSTQWRLVDAQRRGRLLVQPRRRIWPFRPEYLVHCLDPRLSLAEVLALVEINWQIAARRRADWIENLPS